MDNVKHLSEKTLSVEEIYNGKIIDVTKEKVMLESGKETYREVVHHSGGVCIVPITDEGEVVLVRQFRYPYNDVLTELPAGKLEKGEDPLIAGKRELLEEVGVESDNIISLGKVYPTCAYDTEIIYIYLAKNLKYKEQKLDEGEFLDIIKIPINQAYDMVMNGEIPDAKTQIGILKAYNLL